MELLKQMQDIHEKKNADYASKSFFENFKRSAELASWFSDPVDRSFATLVGTKLARLATLLSTGRAPNNESLDDTFLDLTVYCGLWASWNKEKPERLALEKQMEIAKQMQNIGIGQSGGQIYNPPR